MVNSKYLLNPYDGDIFPGEAAGAKLFQILMQFESDDLKPLVLQLVILCHSKMHSQVHALNTDGAT